MTPKHFFRTVSGIAAVLMGVAAVVWALLFLKLIPAEPGNSLFLLSVMEDLAQTKFAAGMGVAPLNTTVLLIGVSLALSAVLSWLSHSLRDRVIRYKLDHGEVTVPIHMVERLVLNMVDCHSGLSLTDVRFYKRHGKPNLSLQLDAAYNSPYMDTVASLKKRLIHEVDSYTGVTLGRVDVRVELVDASPGLGVAGTANMEAVSESESFGRDSSGDDDLGEMTNQVYEESLADLEEVVSTLDDEVVSIFDEELDAIDLSLGASVETEAQDQDIHYQEIRPGGAHNPYYSAIDVMEKAGVNREYIVGWACGYLHNPIREEQCLNEAYETGYEDGMGGDTTNYRGWVNNGEPPTSQHIG